MKILSYLLILFLFISCSENTSNNTSVTNDSETVEKSSEPVKKEETKAPDFTAFWVDFVDHTSDKKYLAENIHFPFMDDVYNKEGLSKEAFEAADYEPYFFKELSERNTSGGLTKEPFKKGGYINGDLEDFLMKQFNNLDNMFVLSAEAAPDGFLAYFKVIDGQYKFVGYESTQAAD